MAVKGLRFASEAGEVKTLFWRGETVPRIVAQARAGDAIDWGGTLVRAGDYTVLRLSEGLGSTRPM